MEHLSNSGNLINLCVPRKVFMLLDQILQTINTELKKLRFEQKDKKLKEKRHLLLLILEKVLLLLQESNAGLDIKKIEDSIYYLQNLQILENQSFGFGFFNQSTIRTVSEILKDTFPVLPDKEYPNKNNDDKILSIDEHIILSPIHIALMEYYTRIKWSYIYPGQTTNEITNITAQWQAKLMKLLDSPTAAYVDFARSVAIMQETGGDKNEITFRIKTLIDRADNYESDKKSQLLTTWLSSNGGQDNSRFINQLFENGFIVPANLSDVFPPSIGLAEDISKPNWDIENGKIIFTFDTLIKTIQFGSLAIIINIDGETKALYGMEEIESALEKNKTPPPFIRTAGKLKLEIVDDVVMPVVEAFFILSYTDFLQHPINDITQENNEEKRQSSEIVNQAGHSL